jgi:hypothetical protein
MENRTRLQELPAFPILAPIGSLGVSRGHAHPPGFARFANADLPEGLLSDSFWLSHRLSHRVDFLPQER